LLVAAVGPYALPYKAESESDEEGDIGPRYAAGLGAHYCNMRKLSIFGGSNEIQKNIISQQLLGL
jgi:alkylation response protein AidB-like acyl-CoA dehydrogenase